MVDASAIRYEEGEQLDDTGRKFLVHAYVNFRICATYTGYMRSVHDSYVTLYPLRINEADKVVVGKHTISIFNLKKRGRK